MVKKPVFSQKWGGYIIHVAAGEYKQTYHQNYLLSTILGSCVTACIRNPDTGYGGMNHFMLPANTNGSTITNNSLRYGSFAMESLINEVLSRGCSRENLEIKVFGGANIIGHSNVGSKNADFVEEFLHNEGYTIAARDLRGDCARRIIYSPYTGRVNMLVLNRHHDKGVFEEEKKYKKTLDKQPVEGTIDLF